jgi:phospholipase C
VQLSKYNQYGFTFAQYGVRVPAIIVSPYIRKNVVDHRIYDHSSIPATIEVAFGVSALTERDKAANSVVPLLNLPNPRTDAPAALPATAAPGTQASGQNAPAPNTTVDSGNLPAFVHVAMRRDLAVSPAAQRHAILARVQAIQTRAQAKQYIDKVRAKIQAARTVQGKS